MDNHKTVTAQQKKNTFATLGHSGLARTSPINQDSPSNYSNL